ncbi:hypothetical protein GCM10009785_21050 [Brooklawnia cerclae]|uniref:Hydrolase of the HAD superfamily n=1 Tax=Brooklawnia cerclae TaxID=349934 RepID=A0ABX0SJN6_9ACTN|nr:putative hydrolase of the HAD superfamily [Brooklawnia cerclae]
MPLLFVDLDNTISDRASSLRRWITTYLTERYGEADPGLAAEIVRADGDGLRDKGEAADDLAEVLGLTPAERDGIIAVLRAGTLAALQPTPGIVEALDRASAAGHTPFIVTNGKVSQQEGKVARLGLADHVAGMVVSEGVGVRKPDPEIFRIAAGQAGDTLEGAWMVGDSPDADIAGAAAAGLPSVWIARGRPYPAGLPRPTHVAEPADIGIAFPQAVDLILDRSR